MADTKVSNLEEILNADVATSDVMLIVDSSVPQTKKITIEELDKRYVPPGVGGAPNAIQFTTDGSTLSGDEDNFAWDNTNKSLTVGTNDPTGTVGGATLYGNVVSATDTGLGSRIELGLQRSENTSATLGSIVFGARSRGTIATKLIVQDGDDLFSLYGAGWDGSQWAKAGAIKFQVDGTPGADSMPSRIIFKTTQTGSITTTERMRIAQDGQITMSGLKWPLADGTANQVLKTDGSGTLSFTTISSGEVNTASNAAGGEGIFKTKSTYDLVFKSLVAGTNISLTPGTDTITITNTAAAVTPGGSDTQIQFNDGGVFGANAGMVYNKTTQLLTLTGSTNDGSTDAFQVKTADGTNLINVTSCNYDPFLEFGPNVGTYKAVRTSNIGKYVFYGHPTGGDSYLAVRSNPTVSNSEIYLSADGGGNNSLRSTSQLYVTSAYSIYFTASNTVQTAYMSSGRNAFGTTYIGVADHMLSVRGLTTDSTKYAFSAYDSANTQLFAIRNDGAITAQKITATELNLSDSVWTDISVPITSIKLGSGSAEPTWTKVTDNGAGSTGLYAYAFDAGTEQEVFFAVEMPHGWKLESDLDVHVHWMPSSTNTGNVVWGLEYYWSNIDGTLGASTIATATAAGSGTAKKHQYDDIVVISGTGKTLSSHLIGRLFRKAADAADTFTGLAYLLTIGVHIELDSLGSREELSK